MVGGERLDVEGSLEEIEGRIIAAARGSIMEMVRLTEALTGHPVAINPEHVVALRAGGANEPVAPPALTRESDGEPPTAAPRSPY